MAILHEHQRLPTSGARTALPFRRDGGLWLAVPQLAVDVPGQPATMNGGDSNVNLLLFRWSDGRFVAAGELPCPGGEDVAVFEIAGEQYMATASIRTGSGPYEVNTVSRIWRGLEPEPRYAIPTFAAKQWHHFAVGDRQFLALAQGLALPHLTPTGPRESRIFEVTDRDMTEFQVLDGQWGYNFLAFDWGGEHYLAYADHSSASLIYRWHGGRFEPFQSLADHGGRAFAFFEADDTAWLAFAVIDGETVLYRWDKDRFAYHQRLGGPGGREFEIIRDGDALYLVRIAFIEGTPAAPKTDLISQIFRWRGDGFDEVETFATFGGTDANAFEADGIRYLAVSNSLTAAVRFRPDTRIYSLDLSGLGA